MIDIEDVLDPLGQGHLDHDHETAADMLKMQREVHEVEIDMMIERTGTTDVVVTVVEIEPIEIIVTIGRGLVLDKIHGEVKEEMTEMQEVVVIKAMPITVNVNVIMTSKIERRFTTEAMMSI